MSLFNPRNQVHQLHHRLQELDHNQKDQGLRDLNEDQVLEADLKV
jgi:hypothetical protein